MHDPTQAAWWPILPFVLDKLRDFQMLAEGDQDEFAKFERYVINELTQNGFQREQVDAALDWIENATRHTGLSDLISIFSVGYKHKRLMNPVEDITFNAQLFARIQQCRQRGLLSDEIAERLLENLRTVDTSDWDDQDVEVYIAETISYICPSLSLTDARKMIGPDHHGMYH